MGLNEYPAKRDCFEHEYEGMLGLMFPCCVCKHRFGTDTDEPCNKCDHNVNAIPAIAAATGQ